VEHERVLDDGLELLGCLTQAVTVSRVNNKDEACRKEGREQQGAYMSPGF
jgi:hypothetical protein